MIRGLFGPAFIDAGIDQRLRWFKMAKQQYMRVVSQAEGVRQ
jgi:hypothetical protein